MRSSWLTAGLYAGGFLGPFGGGVVTAMLPELGEAFGVSAGAASASLTVYMIPFAALMLVSGTYGERWGARRTVVLAYVVYTAASVCCALAQSEALFLAGRAVQGAANAFTTPLLLSAVAAVTAPERLGRALGWFASMQAAGQTFSPLVGGLAAELSWRFAFVGVAVVAAVLAVLGVPQGESTSRPSLRSAWRPRVLRSGFVAMVCWGCLGGLSFLVSLRLVDTFELSAGARGALLTGFGVCGLLTARAVGRAVDRFGSTRCVLVGALVGGVLVVAVGVLPWLPTVALAWAFAGTATQLMLVGLNAIVLTSHGGNRGGAISVLQSLRFLGGALSPAALVPVYQLSHGAAFVLPAVVLAISAPAVLPRSDSP
ncbi:MFS transporter [Allokutzneria multivorans]|uniref:MFS transporter n=1 Tax=Allokutzneria multivorans TaxID=1142134 RepID=A0ABP7U2B5_9PSEU